MFTQTSRVIPNVVKDPALGRRGALASVATTGGLSPQRSLTQRDVCEMLAFPLRASNLEVRYAQHDTNAEK